MSGTSFDVSGRLVYIRKHCLGVCLLLLLYVTIGVREIPPVQPSLLTRVKNRQCPPNIFLFYLMKQSWGHSVEVAFPSKQTLEGEFFFFTVTVTLRTNSLSLVVCCVCRHYATNKVKLRNRERKKNVCFLFIVFVFSFFSISFRLNDHCWIKPQGVASFVVKRWGTIRQESFL